MVSFESGPYNVLASAFLPLSLTLVAVLAFVLLLLRTGWWEYRGLFAGVVFTVAAFWALRALLAAGLMELYRTFGPGNLDVVFLGGLVLSLVAVVILFVLIRTTVMPVWKREI